MRASNIKYLPALVLALFSASDAFAKGPPPSPAQLCRIMARQDCGLEVCRRLEQAGQLTPPYIDVNNCAGYKAESKECLSVVNPNCPKDNDEGREAGNKDLPLQGI